jgi:hypothetical protein
MQDEHGFFLIRAKAGMNPQVLEAFREDGTQLRSVYTKYLKTMHAKLPKRQRVAPGGSSRLTDTPCGCG